MCENHHIPKLATLMEKLLSQLEIAVENFIAYWGNPLC